MAVWPFYALFFAAFIISASGFLSRRLLFIGEKVKRLPIEFRYLTLMVVVLCLVLSHPVAPQAYKYPPSSSSVVNKLYEDISFDASAVFRGRVATFTTLDPSGGDAWNYQFSQGDKLSRVIGNDLTTLGLWYYRIPTLMEYNQFTSPAFHQLVKRSLQVPPVVHQRNITILTTPNERVLRLLGVRYLILPNPIPSIGSELIKETVDGVDWRLFGLESSNVNGYSPTNLQFSKSFPEMLNFVLDAKNDLRDAAVVGTQIVQSLSPAVHTKIRVVDGDFYVEARSLGWSLVVIPVEYSNCLNVIRMNGQSGVENPILLRVDGLLTGILFKSTLDVGLEFRTGPLKNVTCRFKDYLEFRELNV
jgi:hypothetical protein